MRRIRRVAPWIVLFLIAATPAGAQRVANAGGLAIGAGAGAGWSRVSCDFCGRGRDLGPTAHLRVTTPVGTLRVGGEATAWTHSAGEDVREIVGALHAVALLYPRPGGPLYLKGGAGFVTYRADDVASNAPGLQLGAGYELGISESAALHTFVSLTASSFGKLKREDSVVADNVNVTLLQIGLGLSHR